MLVNTAGTLPQQGMGVRPRSGCTDRRAALLERGGPQARAGGMLPRLPMLVAPAGVGYVAAAASRRQSERPA